MDRKHSFNIGYFVFAMLLLSLFQLWLGWRDVALGETVRTQFGVPVHVEHDANAAALAE